MDTPEDTGTDGPREEKPAAQHTACLATVVWPVVRAPLKRALVCLGQRTLGRGQPRLVALLTRVIRR
jgi:hypothetical protein